MYKNYASMGVGRDAQRRKGKIAIGILSNKWLLVMMLLFGMLFTGFKASAQVSVTATTGTVGPTSYTTLKLAFDAINAGTHTGAVTVSISANTTEGTTPANLNSSGAGSASYTSVNIRPTTDGVSVSGNPVTGFGVIQLNGADNVTIDGDNPNTSGTNRNLTVANTTTTTVIANSVIRIATSAAVTSADNNTIKNCILNGNVTSGNASGITAATTSSNSSFGIYCGGNGGATAIGAPTAITSVTTQVAPTGTTINALVIDNNTVNQCARGIVFNGNAAAQSTGITITNNVLGTAGTLGSYPFTTPATTVYTKGIWINGTTALTVTGNTLNNILSYVSTAMTGIELVGAIGAGTINIANNNITAVTNNGTSNGSAGIQVSSVGGPFTVSGNTVSTIQDNTSVSQFGIQVSSAGGIATIRENRVSGVYARSTAGYGAAGICLTTAANGCIIQNNMVWDLNAVDNNSASSTLGPIGIKLASGTGHKVYHNSVNLSGAALAGGVAAEPSACFMVTNTATGLDVRNNIFQNTRTGSFTGSVNSAISLTSGLTSTANYTINNNAYYVPTGTNFYLGSTNSTSTTYTTANFNPASTSPATNWRSYTSTLSAAATNDNASYGSISAAPFTSSTNLLLDTASAETQAALWNKGATGTGVTTDIQGEARPQGVATNPTIGADEVLINVCAGASGGTFAVTTVSKCAGSTHAMSPTGFTTGAGISYQWEISATGGGAGFANVSGGTGATTSSYTTGTLSAGTFYYRLKVVCSNGPVTSYSNELTVTVNALPTVAVTPTSATFCSPGGTPVGLTASGASTYAWSGTGTPGLSASTGISITASPTTSTTITVTGTDANNCINTATATVAISATPAVPTTTPYSVCTGATVPGGQGLISSTPTVGGTQVINFTVAGQPTETNAAPGNIVASATMSALPTGATVTGITLSYPGLVALSSSWRADIRLGLSGAIVNAAAADLSAANSAGTLNYTRTETTGTTATIAGGTVNLLYWDSVSDNAGAEATFPTGAGVATLTINYTYPSTINWYTASSGGTSIGTGTPFNPVGVANSGLVDTNTSGIYAYYAEASNNGSCPSARTAAAFNVVSGATTTDPVASTKCAGQTATFSVTATGPSLTYQWMKDGVDIAVGGNASAGTATLSLTNVQTVDAANYSVRVTATCGSPVTSAAVALTVNALPTVSITPSSGTYCTPGGTAVALTASGASTYVWSPSTGLSATTGTTVNASPSTSQNYTVIGTDVNGCTSLASAPAAITVSAAVTLGTATATPSTICNGANSQLNVSVSSAATYTLSSISSPVVETPGVAPVTTLSTATGFPYNANGTAGDDSYSNAIAVPFTFNFMGASVTQLWASSNGYITFNDPVSIGASAQRAPQTLPSSTTPNNVVALFWHDMDIRTVGNVKYYTTGTSPNKKFIIEYNGVPSFSGGLLHTGQIVMNETSNVIQLYVSASASATKTLGIENSGGTSAVPVTGRNNASWTVSALEGWQFSPPTYTYAWTPNTFLSDASIANPLATAVTSTTAYSVTASAGGCTSASSNVTVTVSSGAAITTDPVASTKCAGQTATFTVFATGPALTYQWMKDGVDIPVGGNASAGTATLSLSNVQSVDVANYSVRVSSSCGSPVTSAAVALTVNPLPSASAGTNQTVCTGATLSLTGTTDIGVTYSWTGPNSFTSTAQNPTISGVTFTAAGTYSFTATSSGGCNSVTSTMTVTVNGTPSAVTVTPSAVTICSGASVNLVASGGIVGGTPTLGTGVLSTAASVTGSTLGPNPLESYYGGAKQQTIILASELTSMGLTTGSAITSLAVNLSAVESGRTLQSFRIKMQHTALNAFANTTFVTSGFTNVRSAGDYTPVLGWNTIAFNNNTFTWDGTSNILIETNFSNNDAGGTGTSTAVYGTTTFVSTLFYRVDSSTPAVVNNATTADFSYSQRNNIQLGFTTPTTFAWTPSNSGLNVYSGTSVNASPTGTTTYTATASLNGCSSSNTATVTVDVPATPTISAGGPTTFCSGGSVVLTSSAGTSYLWSTGATTQSITATTSGSYTVQVGNALGCLSLASAATTVTVTAQPSWYLDADSDGYYTGAAVVQCTSPGVGYTTATLFGSGDCADNNPAINPGATEICYNNIDDNCNAILSEGCAPVVVNMTPSYNGTTLASLATAVPAVGYTYPGATNLKYRFTVTNTTTGASVADIIQTSRYVTIPAVLHSSPGVYTITASAVINDEVVAYAGNTITVNAPVIPKVTLAAGSCGATLASLATTLTANAGLNATGYTFRIRLTSDSSPTPAYGYSSSSTRFVSANSFTGFPLSYGTSYKVSVQYTYTDPVTSSPADSGYGAECTVITPSIPLTGLASPTCGSQVAALNANISATSASYATGYQFRIRVTSDNGSTPTYYYSLPNASRFSSLTAFQGITFAYNTNYSISVQYSIVNNSATVWSGYGAECIVKTPFFPTTALVPSQCGLPTATSLTQQLNITAYPGFPNYKVKLDEINGEDITNSQEIVVTYSYFRLNQFSIAQLGKNYNVSVAIKQGGVFGDYSTACDLFTAAAPRTIKMPFKAVAYPNPFANNFMLDVKTTSRSNVNLKVYDMVGRLIDQRDVNVSDLETTTIGDRYPSGVYNVVVSQEDSVETVRVVKR